MKLDFTSSNEMLFIISQLPSSLKNKIPNEFINELKLNFNKDLFDSFIPDKPFYKQEISDEALLNFYDLMTKYNI